PFQCDDAAAEEKRVIDQGTLHGIFRTPRLAKPRELSTTGIEIEHFLQTHAGSVCQPDRGRPLTNEARPMEAPLEITFEGVSHSETIEALIRKEAKKLDQMDEHITSARVVVAQPQNRHYTGDPN